VCVCVCKLVKYLKQRGDEVHALAVAQVSIV
jgi:hypothetical protein